MADGYLTGVTLKSAMCTSRLWLTRIPAIPSVDDSIFPRSMVVDYVRVYERAE